MYLPEKSSLFLWADWLCDHGQDERRRARSLGASARRDDTDTREAIDGRQEAL